jgi:virginiamycin B lyase
LTWKLPEEKLRTYSISVDTHDSVWLTDFSANAIGRFDPQNERFESFPRIDRTPMSARCRAGGER